MKNENLNPCCLTCLLYEKNGYEDCGGVTEWSAETSGMMYCHTEINKSQRRNKIYLKTIELNNAKYKLNKAKGAIKILNREIKKLKKVN